MTWDGKQLFSRRIVQSSRFGTRRKVLSLGRFVPVGRRRWLGPSVDAEEADGWETGAGVAATVASPVERLLKSGQLVRRAAYPVRRETRVSGFQRFGAFDKPHSDLEGVTKRGRHRGNVAFSRLVEGLGHDNPTLISRKVIADLAASVLAGSKGLAHVGRVLGSKHRILSFGALLTRSVLGPMVDVARLSAVPARPSVLRDDGNTAAFEDAKGFAFSQKRANADRRASGRSLRYADSDPVAVVPRVVAGSVISDEGRDGRFAGRGERVSYSSNLQKNIESGTFRNVPIAEKAILRDEPVFRAQMRDREQRMAARRVLGGVDEIAQRQFPGRNIGFG